MCINYQEIEKSFRKIFEPSEKPKVTYNDNSLELDKSFEDPCWNHRLSTHHRSEMNGIADLSRVLRAEKFSLMT